MFGLPELPLTSETLAVFGTGIGVIIGAAFVAFRGITKGKPTPGQVSQTAQAVAANACGAPAVATLVHQMLSEQRDMELRQKQMLTQLDRIDEQVTRIEDRTRRN